ncbi:hypothetical protein K466DRAFT_334719 [Polyporus arcularius HHB13444]|uniref:Uncharacterized protein n=1 Tax=Polyporus arcularius HHB13444 TaxID=1314778 RepID=A0A5C3NZR7_9APHY|nr:hypothetical protein K466DRAFT_334719 [Polyporus arcularius HHB13444]
MDSCLSALGLDTSTSNHLWYSRLHGSMADAACLLDDYLWQVGENNIRGICLHSSGSATFWGVIRYFVDGGSPRKLHTRCSSSRGSRARGRRRIGRTWALGSYQPVLTVCTFSYLLLVMETRDGAPRCPEVGCPSTNVHVADGALLGQGRRSKENELASTQPTSMY